MTPKHQNAAKTTVTRDVDQLDQEIGNVYQTVVILGKRANQVAVGIKEELGAKLEEFASNGENLEEVYENREQIELSKHYEKMPKPSAIAVQELVEGRLHSRRPEDGDVTPAPAPANA